MAEKAITGWATEELQKRLSNLTLTEGVASADLASSGWVSGEVSIGERKGKSFPIYSLEVEVPWQGTVGGQQVSGTARIPDLSLEMLDDLEVEFSGADLDGA